MINEITNLNAVPITEVKHPNYQEAKKIENAVDVKKALQHIIKSTKILNNKINIEYEEEMGKIIVKVIDDETGKVIRQIPQEEIIKLSKNIDKLTGLLMDKEI